VQCYFIEKKTRFVEKILVWKRGEIRI